MPTRFFDMSIERPELFALCRLPSGKVPLVIEGENKGETEVGTDGKAYFEIPDEICEKIKNGHLYIVPRFEPGPSNQEHAPKKNLVITAIDILEYP